MKSRKYEMPVLSRATQWSEERLGKLSLPELKALQANAERLGEEDIAAQCAALAIQRRREALKAARPLAAKPKPAPKKVLAEG